MFHLLPVSCWIPTDPWDSDTCAQSCLVYEEDTHGLWSSEKYLGLIPLPRALCSLFSPLKSHGLHVCLGCCLHPVVRELGLPPPSAHTHSLATEPIGTCRDASDKPSLSWCRGLDRGTPMAKGGISAPFSAKGTNVSLAQPYQDTCLSFKIRHTWYYLQ